MKFKDYYETLGVKRDASADDIQKAYRKLARKYHPDVNKEKGAEDRFKEINEAYEVLKDQEKRSKYDSLGSNWHSGEDFRPPPNWGGQGMRFEFGGAGGQNFGFGNFSDFFEALFGGNGGFSGGTGQGGAFSQGSFSQGGFGQGGLAQEGQSHEAEITISLEEAYVGGKKSVSLMVNEPGPDGRLTRKTKTLEVKIPSGVKDGAAIRLAGQGSPGVFGGATGDLYLRIRIAPNNRFRVEGANIYTMVPVAPWEALFGTKVTVPLPSGSVSVAVPPGSQQGRRLRLPGKGLQKTKTEKGDLFVEVQIEVPKTVSGEERELWQQLSSVSKFNPREAHSRG